MANPLGLIPADGQTGRPDDATYKDFFLPLVQKSAMTALKFNSNPKAGFALVVVENATIYHYPGSPPERGNAGTSTWTMPMDTVDELHESAKSKYEYADSILHLKTDYPVPPTDELVIAAIVNFFVLRGEAGVVKQRFGLTMHKSLVTCARSACPTPTQYFLKKCPRCLQELYCSVSCMTTDRSDHISKCKCTVCKKTHACRKSCKTLKKK